MKKIAVVCIVLMMCFGLAACNAKEPAKETEKESKKTEGSANMINPVVEYSSLAKINEKVGVNLMKPSIMGVSDERFSIISDKVAQYVCKISGVEWTFRAAKTTEEDISGIHSEHNEFIPGQDFGMYDNEFYLVRFFDDDTQYTISVRNPISEDGEVILEQEVFNNCCMELEMIQKQHWDDPLVGDYQDRVSQRATACVERHGNLYNISVCWAYSNNEITCWTMLDAEKDGDKLTYRGEEIAHSTFDADGNELSCDVTMANNIGYFEIKDGILYWTGAAQEQCRTCEFEKEVYYY